MIDSEKEKAESAVKQAMEAEKLQGIEMLEKSLQEERKKHSEELQKQEVSKGLLCYFQSELQAR